MVVSFHDPSNGEKKFKREGFRDIPVVRGISRSFSEEFPGLHPFAIKTKQINLRIILELLKKEKLYAKFSTCDFWIHIVQFLRHLIDSQGLYVDPAKIEAVKNWASPTTPTELCEAPILALPEGNDDFVVYCDASHQSLGAVLMQREKHILDQKELNMRQLRWLELLANYDCEIRYHPGKADDVADALSQKERIKSLRIRSLIMTLHPKLPTQILEAQTKVIKEENIKAENLRGMDKSFKIHHDRILPWGLILNMSTGISSRYPDGQSERNHPQHSKTCFELVIGFGKIGNVHLPLVEFSYNNSYHASIKAAPFEALYGRKCRSPVFWAEVGDV
ncbi:putative reverse transcriptase domain-containing protein [Tanacetum coccineum]